MQRFFNRAGLALASAFLFGSNPALTAATGPSTSTDPYLTTHLSGVTIKSILTVDDGTVPQVGGGTTKLIGIPDGIGVIDGDEVGESDVFYLLVNHELNALQGVPRDHGSIGAFVSKWKIDKTTHEVLEGEDLIKQFYDWDEGTESFYLSTATFDRLCSSDRPAPTALYNSASGLGSTEIIYFNGEETFGGRAIATVVTGADAGSAYHLEHLGYAAYENVLLNPTEQDATVAMMMDDASNGEVYVYVGTKSATGNEIEKAGLVGGNLYAIAIPAKPYEMDDNMTIAVGMSESIELKLIGTAGDRPSNGVEAELRGAETITPVDATQSFESLKMGGPEDGAWDTRTGYEGTFYFVTKGTASNSLNAVTRIWKLEFVDVSDPTLGGTLTLLQDGPANRLGSLDNMDFEIIGGSPKLLIQEDLGGAAELSRIYEYDIASGQMEELVTHDAAIFRSGGAGFLTENEESSGIVSLKDVLGEGWWASSVQVHTSTGLSNSTELVEHGQLILINTNGRSTDLLRTPLISDGEEWDFKVDGTAPGVGWNDIGFSLDASWNMDTSGSPVFSSPTPIGYGESMGVLATNVGQPASPRPAVAYFRKTFDLVGGVAPVLHDLYLKADDGAVVYINGVEVARYNIDLDIDVDNTTFATENEPAERDWKHIPLTCEAVTLQPTGNVLAVSIHQENDSSSDIRFSAEFFAWQPSPSVGVTPSMPTGLSVSNPTETSLDLTWDTQTDAKFFNIERQAPGDVAWEVIEFEYPGTFTSYTDTGLQAGETFQYRLLAANAYGRSDCTSAVIGTTDTSLLSVIFLEDFETGDFGQLNVVDVLEPAKGWSIVLWSFNTDLAAQGNNFGDGAAASEDWLITNYPINFEFWYDEVITLDTQISFSGPATELLYSVDYDPVVHSDPNDATWVPIQIGFEATGSLTTMGPYDLSGIPSRAYIALKYSGEGSSGGQSARVTVDDIMVAGLCGYNFSGADNVEIALDSSSSWEVFNLSSELGWIYATYAGQQGAINNNFGSSPLSGSSDATANDWLISPAFATDDESTVVEFEYYENFGDTLDTPLTVLVTDNYTGDPITTEWIDITPGNLDGSTSGTWIQQRSLPIGITGKDLHIAFWYQSAGNGGGTTKRLGVDTICILSGAGPLGVEFTFQRNGGTVHFNPTISGGVPPFEASWDFGDGESSSELGSTHSYMTPGTYNVTLTVTDSEGNTAVANAPAPIIVTQYLVPEKAGDLRVATYNVSMNRSSAGTLAEDLDSGTDPQIAQIAEAIQRVNPDIILLNEFDHVYTESGAWDRRGTITMINDFREKYLGVAQATDTSPVAYRYYYVAPCNTGVPSGFDFNNNGRTTDSDDGYGFGDFPGQYSMVILSKHRITGSQARTFQNFLWKDMPGAFLPTDPNDSDGDGDLSSYYNENELEVFRLSSKSHWDVPVFIGRHKIHLLASHPTPPVFDDGTATEYPSASLVDWNGLRNHDEIRFWADYIDPSKSSYIYDDRELARARGRALRRKSGGLKAGESFIVLGDQNADPIDGDATMNPIMMLLSSPLVDTSVTPVSAGALEQIASGSERETKTSSFELRADYALPSTAGLEIEQAFVFWPLLTDLEASLLSASDHRMVVVDLSFE